MNEQMDEREVRYLGQEAAVALQNKALIRVCEDMYQDALEQLIGTDPTNVSQVAIAQLRIKAAAELGDRLEHMALRANAMAEAEETVPLRDLN